MADTPFVLLDDARPGGAPARLFRAPVAVVTADTVAQVHPALDRVRAGVARGLHAAGILAFEAGAAFDPALPVRGGDGPLLWFGLFAEAEPFDPAALPDPAGAWAGTPEPLVTPDAYRAKAAAVLDLIAAGDLYQANLTFRARVPVAGDPLALYAGLRARSGAGWGAVVWTGSRWLLSLSPELFFRLDADGNVACRPMKGTAPRGDTPAGDAALAAALAVDPKQRAENLMIVDLMRNDLARVAVAGSVAVPELFTVERYPTLHQLTSAVTARLRPGLDAVDVLAALFPCGSITGAPKVRAAEVLATLEDMRGPYTGAIGHLDPDGAAQFSVAIRTLEMEGLEATLGIGSGIVADSDPAAEWRECLAKAAFVATPRRFDLIETMAFDPEEGLAHLDRHVERLSRSADLFGFAFDRHAARNELQAATFRLRDRARVRLLLARSGAVAIEAGPIPPAPAGPVAVAVVPLPVDRDDFRLRHKTSDRRFYDEARGGRFEVVFADRDGFLTEGSFTSLFVPRDGRLLTPPLSRGLLPGVLRAVLLAEGRAAEAELTAADLAGGFFVGNAVRGLIPAVAEQPNRPL